VKGQKPKWATENKLYTCGCENQFQYFANLDMWKQVWGSEYDDPEYGEWLSWEDMKAMYHDCAAYFSSEAKGCKEKTEEPAKFRIKQLRLISLDSWETGLAQCSLCTAGIVFDTSGSLEKVYAWEEEHWKENHS
jgi:hypothetical protein